jgi:hypothetical protein
MLRFFLGVLLVAGWLAPTPAAAQERYPRRMRAVAYEPGPDSAQVRRARWFRTVTYDPAPTVVRTVSNQVSAPVPVVPNSAEPVPPAVVASESSARPVPVTSRRIFRLRPFRSWRAPVMVYGP